LVSATALAWQLAHRSFICSAVNVFVAMMAGSEGFCPPASDSKSRTCSPAGPWQASQLMPGSFQVVR